MSPVSFSVIIPTYNRAQSLLSCLLSLNNAYKLAAISHFECVISDDGIAAITRSILSNHQFSFNYAVLQGPSKGPAANRNFAAATAKNDFLIFIDDDCMVDSQLLIAYRNAITHFPQVNFFEGKIMANRIKSRYNEESPENLNGSNFWSCNICVNKEFFFNIGQFDEHYPYPFMEDVDIFVRIQSAALPIKFIPQALVIHPYRIKLGWSAYLKATQSILFFHKKHYNNLKPSKWMYFKIFLLGLPQRTLLLFKYYGKGSFDYLQENIFFLLMAIKFYKLIASFHK